MSAKSYQYAYDLLRLIFNAVTMGRLAENDSVNGVTQFYLSLHTADPSVNGLQTSSETNYVGYARQAVNRTAAAFPCTPGVVNSLTPPNVKLGSDCDFPDTGAGTANQTLTYWGLGLDPNGAGELLYHGKIDPVLPIIAGQSGPILAAGTLVQEL